MFSLCATHAQTSDASWNWTLSAKSPCACAQGSPRFECLCHCKDCSLSDLPSQTQVILHFQAKIEHVAQFSIGFNDIGFISVKSPFGWDSDGFKQVWKPKLKPQNLRISSLCISKCVLSTCHLTCRATRGASDSSDHCSRCSNGSKHVQNHHNDQQDIQIYPDIPHDVTAWI